MAGHVDSGSTGTKLTYEDYVSLPDDGRRYEILDGDLAMTPSPLVRHQRVSGALFDALWSWVEAHDLGVVLAAPTDVILDDTTVVVPDIVYVSKAREAIVTERAVEGAPDLVIEILSPATEHRDRGVKAKLYARFGVEHYWIVDTVARTVEVHECHDGAYVLAREHAGDAVMACSVPPGLAIDLVKVWPD